MNDRKLEPALRAALDDLAKRTKESPDYIEDCVGCQTPLFVGDLGYSYEDGPKTCAVCAPTWHDAKSEIPEGFGNDPEDRKSALAKDEADMVDVTVEIKATTVDEQHFVVMTTDGIETDRWGPYADYSDALIWAQHLGAKATAFVKKKLSQ